MSEDDRGSVSKVTVRPWSGYVACVFVLFVASYKFILQVSAARFQLLEQTLHVRELLRVQQRHHSCEVVATAGGEAGDRELREVRLEVVGGE